MTTINVRATTTQKAMEELLRRLGPDALILSTRHVDGEVEVVSEGEWRHFERPAT